MTQGLLERATPLEAKYLIKIILGDMRTGIKVSLVEEAIAAAYGGAIAEVRHARMLNGNLPEVLELAATGRLAEARMRLFHPLGFMLASPVETVEEALQRFSTEVAEEGLAGPVIKEAQLEDKYDGVRAQIHCGSPEDPGRVALFSRSREDMTASFPELVEAFADFKQPMVLDGEILAWSSKEDRALPFSSLQARLGRKRVTTEMRESVPVVFMAFDVLYTGGQMMMEKPLQERRQVLEELVEQEQARTRVGSRSTAAGQQTELLFEAMAATDGFARLVLAPAVQLESVAQLEQAYVDARARGNEGVMLKARHSVYQPGRRGLAWLKLKRELATLDVVVTAAEYGHGRRAGWLSDYTFAVRDGDVLRNVGKAYSGVTDAEIARLTQFFLEHTLEDYGGIRAVEPLVVFEVAFNNVMRSDRHDSGFALRFPRILRIRDDKPVSEIDTLERVAEIYQSQPDKPVESAGD
jgi:DNA ligase-1